MRQGKYLTLIAMTLLVGCSANVVTYDQQGQRIGSCKATGFLIPIHGAASCYGYAHDDNLRFAKVQSNGELELLDLPKNSKVQLTSH